MVLASYQQAHLSIVWRTKPVQMKNALKTGAFPMGKRAGSGRRWLFDRRRTHPQMALCWRSGATLRFENTPDKTFSSGPARKPEACSLQERQTQGRKKSTVISSVSKDGPQEIELEKD
ncbi:MAG: hypothetical protein OEZ59_09615 [Deltaproteobacteria bacterium]|nr:hypothetical protein [Deltaproteobacteria bacterium]